MQAEVFLKYRRPKSYIRSLNDLDQISYLIRYIRFSMSLWFDCSLLPDGTVAPRGWSSAATTTLRFLAARRLTFHVPGLFGHVFPATPGNWTGGKRRTADGANEIVRERARTVMVGTYAEEGAEFVRVENLRHTEKMIIYIRNFRF